MSDHTTLILEQIAEERERQIELGWTIEHDDRHGVHHLVTLAEKRAHAENAEDPGFYSRDNLVEAAALMVAAIERLDRSI